MYHFDHVLFALQPRLLYVDLVHYIKSQKDQKLEAALLFCSDRGHENKELRIEGDQDLYFQGRLTAPLASIGIPGWKCHHGVVVKFQLQDRLLKPYEQADAAPAATATLTIWT